MRKLTVLLFLFITCGDIKKPVVDEPEGKKFLEKFFRLRIKGEFTRLVKGPDKFLSDKFLTRFTPDETGKLNEPILREKLLFLNDPRMDSFEITEGIVNDLQAGTRYGTVYSVKIKLKYADGRNGGYLEEQAIVGREGNTRKGKLVVDDLILIQRQIN